MRYIRLIRQNTHITSISSVKKMRCDLLLFAFQPHKIVGYLQFLRFICISNYKETHRNIGVSLTPPI